MSTNKVLLMSTHNICFYEEIRKIIPQLLTVAQLDGCSTGDQEVAGSIPANVGNILSWRLIIKYFLWSFSPFR